MCSLHRLYDTTERDGNCTEIILHCLTAWQHGIRRFMAFLRSKKSKDSPRWHTQFLFFILYPKITSYICKLILSSRYILCLPLHALSAHPATVHDQHMAANIGARPRRKVHRCALEVFRGAPAASRDSSANASQSLGVVEQGCVHVRLNVAGSNGVNRDALGRPLVGKRLCQLADSTLGSCVGRDSKTALEGKEGCVVDDTAAAASDGRGLQLEHMGADVAAEGEDGVEVDLDDLVEVAVGELFTGVTTLDAGAVDEDADLVLVGEDLGRESSNGFGDSHVCRVDPGFAAELFDGLLGFCDGCISLQIQNISYCE